MLKELLRPKAVSYITSSERGTLDKALSSEVEAIREKGLDKMVEWEELDLETKESLHSLKDMVFYNELMHALKKEEPGRYEAMKAEIRARGGEAEIDIRYLERKFPAMRQINSMFQIYRAEILSRNG
jgi:hypothetical protein